VIVCISLDASFWKELYTFPSLEGQGEKGVFENARTRVVSVLLPAYT